MNKTQRAQAVRFVRQFQTRKETSPSTQRIRPHQRRPSQRLTRTGTGFFVNTDGMLITAHHVVKTCPTIRVPSVEGPLTMAGFNTNLDVALLRAPRSSSSAAVFRSAPTLRKGESVYVYGFPLQGFLSSEPKITDGIISSLTGPGYDRRVLQITAPVQSGNSGAPLLDPHGNIVGMVSSKFAAYSYAQRTGEIPQNVNFAIAGETLKRMMRKEGVSFRKAASGSSVKATKIAQQANDYTVKVQCFE